MFFAFTSKLNPWKTKTSVFITYIPKYEDGETHSGLSWYDHTSECACTLQHCMYVMQVSCFIIAARCSRDNYVAEDAPHTTQVLSVTYISTQSVIFRNKTRVQFE